MVGLPDLATSQCVEIGAVNGGLKTQLLQLVSQSAPFDQEGQGDVRGCLMQVLQDGGVEALEHAGCSHVRRLDLLKNSVAKDLYRGAEGVLPFRSAFDLNIEQDLTFGVGRPPVTDGLEYILQCRLGGLHRLLVWESTMAQATTIILPDFGKPELVNIDLRLTHQGLAFWTSADLRIHPGFMGDQDIAIPGDHHIQLQYIHSEIQSVQEGGNGVLRKEATTSPMALDLDLAMTQHGADDKGDQGKSKTKHREVFR